MTPAQIERLAVLTEELGESVQEAMKILRHGYDSYSPTDADKTLNRTKLEKELGDVFAIVRLMIDNGDVDDSAIARYTDVKYDKLRFGGAYLHHN